MSQVSKHLIMKNDNVNRPAHYTQGKVECIDAIESATTGLIGIVAVCVANVIKYVWRFARKNGIEDLDKADYYLQKLRTKVREDNESRSIQKNS